MIRHPDAGTPGRSVGLVYRVSSGRHHRANPLHISGDRTPGLHDSLLGSNLERKCHERSSPDRSRGGVRLVRDDSRKLCGSSDRGAQRGPRHDGGARGRHRAIRETMPGSSLLRESLAGICAMSRTMRAWSSSTLSHGWSSWIRPIRPPDAKGVVWYHDGRCCTKTPSGITWPTIGSFRAMATTGSTWPKIGAESERRDRSGTPARCSTAGPCWSSSRGSALPPSPGATRLPPRFANSGPRMREIAWPTKPTSRPTRWMPAG